MSAGSSASSPCVIIGSGPAAAGAALALRARGKSNVLVVDIGGDLEPDRRDLMTDMSQRDPGDWSSWEVGRISEQPVTVAKGTLPQKRAYGSDFPFRDLGQLAGFDFVGAANSSPVSGAYGGFSNVWGAQVMPFSRSTFDNWPIDFDEIAPHYRAVFDEVPLAAEEDDLLGTFPLLTDRAQNLPPLPPRTMDVLRRYAKHRDRIRAAGITVGRARLALHARQCRSTNLCMTGCPYGLIYSASQTFDRLRAEGAVRYEGGMLVTAVGEDAEGPYVRVRSLRNGTRSSIRAERIYVACGGIGSTRLIVGSIANPPERLEMDESIQFAVPFVSMRSMGDPRGQSTFTLNQFNMLVSFDDNDYYTSQVHCYPYNPAVLAALPAPLKLPLASPVTRQVLARLTIGLGYLPYWASPTIPLEVTRTGGEELPHVRIGANDAATKPLMLNQVMKRLRSVGHLLDLHPVGPATQVSATAKSYHFGGSLPHRRDPSSHVLATDRLGRIPAWAKIHVVDGSVLPSVPSTTFTLTVMANAHRIAAATAENER